MKNQKLELTWIGKDIQPKLEPRILIEDPDMSYGDRNTENMLIHGDNLLALKALEQDFEGAIKCVYIDPPFNTGEAFEHYDDGLEHSVWLDLIAKRIQIIHKLLSPDGTMFIHIDDNELAYLIATCDEIFGRKNRINIITFKQSSASGPKAINPGLVTTCNYIVFYAKDRNSWKPNRIYQAVPRDNRYSSFIENYEEPFTRWRLCTLREAFSRHHKLSWNEVKAKFADKLEDELLKFVIKYSDRVVQPALVRDKDINEDARKFLQKSREDTSTVYCSEREDKDNYYFLNGKQLLFYKSKVRRVGGIETSSLAASNIWDDLLSNNVHQEGGVSLPNGKKPEALLERILSFVTNPGDLVFDSFGGSGTTSAAAHKMGRKWITVELGEHCHTHIQPRLKNICNGTDQTGISKAVNWQGGGGFKYYYMAPSLLKKDRYNQWVINEEYNATMMAAAMAKHENFRYCPDEIHYWKQGQSSEKDFIFTTTVHLTPEHLDRIHEEMQADESLLICCKSHFEGADGKYSNITVKKIPSMLLGKCEFGRDDYSLNIVDMPRDPNEPEFVPSGPPAEPKKEERKTKAEQSGQLEIFAGTGE